MGNPMNTIQAFQHHSTIITQIDPASHVSEGVLSLEQRLTAAASSAFVEKGEEKNILQTAIDNPSNTSDPAALLEIQKRTVNYEGSTMLISPLTHKAVDALNTLLKAS